MRFAASILILVLLGLPACGGRPAAADTNLLLVTVDTLRADRLGAYGYDSIETPEIDRLAREGVRFSRALTPVPLTLPAHATLFTGATPLRHGIRQNGSARLRPSAVTLAESFRGAGFATGGFVGAFVLDPRYGLAQGFDAYTAPGPAAGSNPARDDASERRGDAVVADAVSWIRNQRDHRWFAWVHLFDPHATYSAPEPFASSYGDRPYDGEVAWVDSLVGELRVALEQSGQWADTTVILTSDHGEALGDHGEPTHGFFLYEATLRVPLIVRPADRRAGSLARDLEVTTPVGLVDVFPTVAQLWGLERDGSATLGEDERGGGIHRQLEGRSLVPALRGEAMAAVPLYAETVLPRAEYGWAELVAVVDGADKYIRAPRPELYDVRDDPGERHNLASERPRRAAELRRALGALLDDAAVVEGGANAPAGTEGVEPEALARLRSLGYLGSAGAPGAVAADRPDPKDKIDTYNTLLEILGAWRDGDAEAALALVEEALRETPASPGAWYYRGLVLSDLGRLQEAAAAFARARELDPGHVVAARWLARTRQRLGDLDGAVTVLEELLEDDVANVQLRWEIAQFHLRRDEPMVAEAVLREGLEVREDDPRLLLGLGQVDLERDQFEAALRYLDQAARLAPELEEVHFHRGRALRRLGRVDEALEAFATELRHRPLHFGASLERAVLLSGQRRYAAAIEALRNALRARPDSPRGRLFLAQTLLDSGEPEAREEARRLAEEVVRTVDDAGLRRRGHTILARAYRALGRDREARAHEELAERIVVGR